MVTMSYFLNRETLTKPWINMNREKKTRDMITALCKLYPNKATLERRSAKMAKIVRKHYNCIQSRNKLTDRGLYKKAMEEVLSYISTTITSEQRSDVNRIVSKAEIDEVIKELKNGKAASLNGIVLEL